MGSNRNIRIELNFNRADVVQRRVGSILEALPRGAKRNYVMRLMAQDARLPGSPKSVAMRVAANLQESMMSQGDNLEAGHLAQDDADKALSRQPKSHALRQNRESEPLGVAPDSQPLHGQPIDEESTD